jgi:hypothetical protein
VIALTDFADPMPQQEPEIEQPQPQPITPQDHINLLIGVASGQAEEVSTIQLAQAVSWCLLELLQRSGVVQQQMQQLLKPMPKIALR